MSKPQPDGENDSSSPDDGIMNLALDVVNSVTGVYGGISTAVIKYALNADSNGGITVDYNSGYSNGGDQEQYYWDLPLEQNDEEGNVNFPDQTDNIAGASFKVENGMVSGWTAQIETRSRFEFGYLDYRTGRCPCDVAPTVFKTTKTGLVSNIVEYTSVET
ncbi:hypothetical protein [Haloarchaeobius iranensis]|uniref:Uncharacterized protein n=2 Tax=Haloarchaeobius iranensis TaxID=996166 RepID=A0A1H0ABF7_9EURY|nr:hypothetical protein [Haloarchaeobius iranensis]SDN30026.1 hypothetical protein SAMN05192554_12546 [Haloarchaeobius iranensis]